MLVMIGSDCEGQRTKMILPLSKTVQGYSKESKGGVRGFARECEEIRGINASATIQIGDQTKIISIYKNLH